MKKQEITLYSFNELDEKLQEKILEKEMNSQRDFYLDCCLYDDLMYDATEQLNSLFENVNGLKLLYDFSYSQGSGLLTTFEFTFKNQLVKVKQNPYNHWYTYATNFILEFEDEEPITDEDEKDIRQKIATLNADLEKLGYSIIEDDDFYKNEALDYFADLKEAFLENGEQFIF